MFLTERIEKAIVRATVLHQSQKRRISGVPYIVHPYSVAFLLAHYVEDEDVIIAGLLHDTLEDIPEYTDEMLRREFGERVYTIVKEVTEDFTQAEKKDHSTRNKSWRRRKEKYLENLKNDSEEALLIAAADKIHNLRSFLTAFEESGKSAWMKFSRERDMVWFYEEVVKIIDARLKHPIVLELRKTLQLFSEKARSVGK